MAKRKASSELIVEPTPTASEGGSETVITNRKQEEDSIDQLWTGQVVVNRRNPLERLIPTLTWKLRPQQVTWQGKDWGYPLQRRVRTIPGQLPTWVRQLVQKGRKTGHMHSTPSGSS